MSAARPPRSIRVAAILLPLRERSPAILLRVSALRVTIACAGVGARRGHRCDGRVPPTRLRGGFSGSPLALVREGQERGPSVRAEIHRQHRPPKPLPFMGEGGEPVGEAGEGPRHRQRECRGCARAGFPLPGPSPTRRGDAHGTAPRSTSAPGAALAVRAGGLRSRLPRLQSPGPATNCPAIACDQTPPEPCMRRLRSRESINIILRD
jgi:hypothetical protein